MLMWIKNVTPGRQHQQLAILNKLMLQMTLVANWMYALKLINFNKFLNNIDLLRKHVPQSYLEKFMIEMIDNSCP